VINILVAFSLGIALLILAVSIEDLLIKYYRSKRKNIPQQPLYEEIAMPEKLLVKYLRNVNREPFACVVAFEDQGQVMIGWSQCNPMDQFRKIDAKMWAIDRANNPNKYKEPPAEHPTTVAFFNGRGNLEVCYNERQCIYDAVQMMQEKAQRYFSYKTDDNILSEAFHDDSLRLHGEVTSVG
jgi:hypothetical protein